MKPMVIEIGRIPDEADSERRRKAPEPVSADLGRLPKITWPAAAWIAGTLLAARFEIALGPSLLVAGLTLALAWCFRERAVLGWLAICLFCLSLGGARLALARPVLGPRHVASLRDGPEVSLRGRIVAEPDRRDRRSDYRVEVDGIWRAAGKPDVDSAMRGAEQARAPRPSPGTWQPMQGLVLAQLPPFPPHRYGERVLLEGRLESPPELEGFDYAAWLERKGIYAIAPRATMTTLDSGGGNPLRHGLIALRERGRRALAAALPEPEAALATGILLGDARRIPRAVDEAFQLTGTSHVIAISGSNISLLVVLLLATLGRFLGRRRAVPIILLVLGLYSILVGADAAVVRAAIMGGLMVLAGYLGRPGDATAALMAAAWGMSIWNPHVAWDLGFQLSFAATAGLIAFSARFSEGLEAWLARGLDGGRAKALVQLTNEAVLVTLAAQLTTWPIIAWQLGQVSLSGLAANFLILPAQPAVMGLGGLSMALGMLWTPAGRLLGLAAWLPLAWTIRVVEVFAALPFASVELPLPAWAMLLYYLSLGLWLQAGARKRLIRRITGLRVAIDEIRRRRARRGMPAGAWQVGQPGRDHQPIVRAPAGRTRRGPAGPRLQAFGRVVAWIGAGWRPVLPLAGACALAWIAAYARPDGLLHIIQLDVGQGDAILVISPNGRRMLVDGGPSPSALLDALGRQLPPWDRRLDLLVLSHPDGDHVGGLPALLERYAVGTVIDPELPAETPDAGAWAQALSDSRAHRVRASAGGRIVLDTEAGVTADILWPPDPRLSGTEADVNNNSTVLLLRHGKLRFLLTGDIEAESEAALLAAGAPLEAELLKVAHHGSGGSSTPDFLAAVQPRLAIIGVGAENRYGHPDPGALERLAPALVRRTDWQGSIEVLSDGRDLWLP